MAELWMASKTETQIILVWRDAIFQHCGIARNILARMPHRRGDGLRSLSVLPGPHVGHLRRGCGLAFSRQSLSQYLLPAGAFLIAIAIELSGVSIREWSFPARIMIALLLLALVIPTVFVVLHHAEQVASRIGEPYGTLLLTLAVTSIEVSLIVSLTLHGADNPALARESVFSTVMIVTTGVVGLCLTLGGLRHRTQDIQRQGTSAFLAVLIALTTLSLILPNYTLSAGPGNFSLLQLGFVSIVSIAIYGAFLFAQMVSHQEHYAEEAARGGHRQEHALQTANTATSVVLMVLGLIGIVLLAERMAGGIEDSLEVLHLPQADAILGAFVATLVLLPEAVSAIRAALDNHAQRSLNVALGSACATIGLTIPAVAVASLVNGTELTLGLGSGDTVMLLLALSISVVSFGTGRTTSLTGFVHLAIFGAYLFLIAVP